MSHLADHARAARILAFAFDEESTNPHKPMERRLLLKDMATAFSVAASRMDAEVREARIDHACTMDHRTMPAAKCAACGAPRG